MSIAILGGGAFGTALALTLSADGTPVTLWIRDAEEAGAMTASRRTGRRLPGLDLPPSLAVTSDMPDAELTLLTVPAQTVRAFLERHAHTLASRSLVTCAKGIERRTGLGPVSVVTDTLPGTRAGILTGPSFAVDIARGLPTALVLAMPDVTEDEQAALSRPALRVYRTDDVAGAELGGALKNVIALAAGMAIGAGLGDSARAALIARGFAEMTRFTVRGGGRPETLAGLSGLGDLVLTATSDKSRNFAAGCALGRGETLDSSVTVEGVATAQALAETSTPDDMPITHAVAAVTRGDMGVIDATDALLARPMRKE
ncbi:NAD(P)-dependent glycerol-3-phosphate dehydrogenase [Silicimonas algicola]|uniref:Glycerol-3-phosphate dehydrogenase [NAD(P)+] n=1 Tax=Silicimonas algicola TaxID=1826607 RepID=A0A316G6G7_9RHOB|nr:NAD(P)H-dependent glycerol-3-phosphate dehydrogenase [Silicimonas algicola]AZQ69479.1 NAD(P)-dependent glycerol-3-phosphate dehydrogenase [Silicimonas algicola]PWK56549.1 glycerol-3-phosphate dehydrogenase (NAD(P)+) [Silicimonas algicola]